MSQASPAGTLFGTSIRDEVEIVDYERYRSDRIGYTDGKTAFVRETLSLAEAWAAATGWRVDTSAKA